MQVVGGDEAGGGEQGDDLEEGLPDAFFRVHALLEVEGDGDDGGGDEGDGGVPAEFLVTEQFFDFSAQGEVQEAEVDSRDEHEYGDDVLDVGGVPVGEAGGLGGESSRGHGGEGVADGVEEAHASEREQEDEAGGEGDVEHPHVARHGAEGGGYFVVGGAGDFGDVEVFALDAESGEDGDEEDDDSESAQPVGQGPPEQGGVGERLDLV